MNKMNIQKHIKEYFKDHPEVVAVYLFGSFAKGHGGKGSDVDLGILLKHEYISNENEFHNAYMSGLTRQLSMDIHLIFMNKAGEGILQQIFKYGKCVVNNSPGGLAKFKMKSYSMIAEFSYSKSIMKKGFLKNLFEVNE